MRQIALIFVFITASLIEREEIFGDSNSRALYSVVICWYYVRCLGHGVALLKVALDVSVLEEEFQGIIYPFVMSVSRDTSSIIYVFLFLSHLEFWCLGY